MVFALVDATQPFHRVSQSVSELDRQHTDMQTLERSLVQQVVLFRLLMLVFGAHRQTQKHTHSQFHTVHTFCFTMHYTFTTQVTDTCTCTCTFANLSLAV